MDLKSLSTIGKATIDIKHPTTREKLGISIVVIGSDSREYFDLQRKLSADEEKKAPLEHAKNVARELIIDWENVQIDGKEVKCTEKNIDKAFDLCPWLAEQVWEFSLNRANFLPKPQS